MTIFLQHDTSGDISEDCEGIEKVASEAHHDNGFPQSVGKCSHAVTPIEQPFTQNINYQVLITFAAFTYYFGGNEHFGQYFSKKVVFLRKPDTRIMFIFVIEILK